MWLAVTSTVIALVAVILGLAAALALSVAQLFEEQWASEIETSAGGWPIRPVHRNARIVGDLPGPVGSSTRHAVESCPNAELVPH